MSTLQEYWDACLIMAWRNFETYGSAQRRFHSIVGIYPDKVDPPLLRMPKFFPNGSGVRVMTSSYLEKINNWLLNHDKAEDTKLLKNLKESKYTVHAQIRESNEMTTERARVKRNRMRSNFESMKYRQRNRDTNWGVTK